MRAAFLKQTEWLKNLHIHRVRYTYGVEVQRKATEKSITVKHAWR